MRNISVAKRYGLALFSSAKEQNLVDSTENEPRAVKEVFLTNKGFTSLLSTPKLTLEKKKQIINETFSKCSPNVLNTLLLLTDRHRIDYVVDIVDAYILFANEDRGVADAIVYSVKELTEEELATISSTFASKVGKQALRIQNVIDKKILGGLKVRIGNTIYDGSLTQKLVRVKQDIMLKRS